MATANPPQTPPGQSRRPLKLDKCKFVSDAVVDAVTAKASQMGKTRLNRGRVQKLLRGNGGGDEPAISSTSETGQEALRRIGCRV